MGRERGAVLIAECLKPIGVLQVQSYVFFFGYRAAKLVSFNFRRRLR